MHLIPCSSVKITYLVHKTKFVIINRCCHLFWILQRIYEYKQLVVIQLISVSLEPDLVHSNLKCTSELSNSSNQLEKMIFHDSKWFQTCNFYCQKLD